MTPSPSPTSTPSSRPTSSPTDTVFQDAPRPSLVSLTLPPISQISFQPDFHPPQHMGAPAPSGSASAPEISESSGKRSRHGKEKSDDSIGPSSSDILPQAIAEDNPVGPEQSAELSGTTSGEPEPPRHQGKKKRTRTLTTPHQSAVLHALLAQSRFPTTAMREEVGRSIGLSARKVQVWFQNQRQKARKPRNQSSAPVDRPPQFGPFSSGPSTDTNPASGPSGVLGSYQEMVPIRRHSPYPPEGSSSFPHPRGLPAPNPGLSLHSQHQLPEFLEYAPTRPPEHGGMTYNVESLSPARSAGPPIGFFPPYPPYQQFPPDDYSRHPLPGISVRRSEPPIVLPPLRFDQPRGQFQGSVPPSSLHGMNPHIHPDLPRSASFPSLSPSDVSSSSSSHPSPFTISQPPSRHGENIPPPFTLQPEPQWDPPNPGPRPIPALNTPVGPSQSPFSHGYTRHRTNSDPSRTLPPLYGMQIEEGRPLITQPWPLPSQRSERNVSASAPPRRFDPVHSVVSEGERDSTRATEGERGNGSRQNRHTYDFGRPSGSMSLLSPPPAPDETQQGTHHDSDEPD